jgi:hypothetical protein
MISPASRGIGFALARRVLQTTNAPVVATARKDLDKTKEALLEGLDIDEARLSVLKIDVTGMFTGVLRSEVTKPSSFIAIEEVNSLVQMNLLLQTQPQHAKSSLSLALINFSLPSLCQGCSSQKSRPLRSMLKMRC